MKRCIQLDMECATLCYAAARLMSIGSEQAGALCRLCAEMCERCSEECGKHAHEHCKECSEACKTCAEHCRKMAA
ncbi:four-helix bundle copper-binding protein [Fluviicola chungangensis]|nr:four-helix bundle copper-binding protein [Fluviicola chungangensis]